MRTAKFKFKSAETTIYFEGSFRQLDKIAAKRRVIIITDENIHQAHNRKFAGKDVIVLKAGESYKVQETVDAMVNTLLRMEADRAVLLVGVGGGVVTDLTGYLASIFLRGVSFGFIPTSLLALVDASIGGKNGIDVGEYKNMVGTIRQPEFILHDHSFLRSLPDGEWNNGMAEVIKHASIGDRKMFLELEKLDLSKIQKNKQVLGRIITTNALFKIKLVQQDEFEKEERRKLNFGHTLGHAIETQYEVSHGQAISIGMIAACRVSEKLLGFKETGKVKTLLEKFDLPTEALYNRQKVFNILASDKKRAGSSIRFVLLSRIGKAELHSLSLERLKGYLEELL
jgi:3-dehydroquinate synthase